MSERLFKSALAIIGLAFIVIVACMIANRPFGAIAPASSKWPQPDFQAAKRAVIARLKDPDSAKFRNLFEGRSNTHPVCGEVNARNGFGGYTGMKPFIYYVSIDDVQIIEEDSLGIWKETCLGIPRPPPEPLVPYSLKLNRGR